MTALGSPTLTLMAALCLLDGPPSLEQRLKAEDPALLARSARESGDPARGAIVFHQPALACTQCHGDGSGRAPLGPDLAKLGKDITDVALVESILSPSKAIEKGFETVAIATKQGTTVTGLLAEDRPDAIVLRDPSRGGALVTIARAEIEERGTSPQSLMPAGLVNQLASRQQFLDLVSYLREMADIGRARARALRPDPALLAVSVPDYERDIDHAGLVAERGSAVLKRGKAIYDRVCVNCHGTKDAPGSLPTSLRFSSGVFKNGGDPYAMYRTLTYGFGQMAPQTWMVPRQKYEVIHYIREAILKPDNPSQYASVDRAYLSRLPRGTGRGPEPSTIEPWVTMDYGPTLSATIEVGDDGANFAYKGIAVRLDAGPGGVSRGRAWAVYDHDTLRLAGVWTGQGFIDWNGINFNGKHQVHPRVVGRVDVANPGGPGWADPTTGRFDDPRPRGRDGRPYGPFPRPRAHFRGLCAYDRQAILSYTVGATSVLESPGVETAATDQVFRRTLNLGPRAERMIVQVARDPGGVSTLRIRKRDESTGGEVVAFGDDGPGSAAPFSFDGATGLEVAEPRGFDLDRGDYTISVRMRTRTGGSLFSKAPRSGPWTPGGKAFFIRGGRLTFDIGWVGAVSSRRKVDDDRWHDVAMTYEHKNGRVRLFIDGRQDGEGRLDPGPSAEGNAIRLGYTSPDFPEDRRFFQGQIREIRFHQRALTPGEIAGGPGDDRLVASWKLEAPRGETTRDESGHAHDATRFSDRRMRDRAGVLLASLSPPVPGARWRATGEGDLRLEIPAGDQPLRFAIRLCRPGRPADRESVADALLEGDGGIDLAPMTCGGPPRWPGAFTTRPKLGDDSGPFAADDLTLPGNNPWSCQLRLTGFDFLPDGTSAAVCTWDGDVWRVDGVDRPERGLTWRRIASGLFQPLGLKVLGGQIFVSCRDQIVHLRDLNGDGETDFYENFNSDHQVTEHFHEFAMDLQADAANRLYYTKAARHGLPALVPQHGTLLRVAEDGTRTDILATGFRAPNGVCLNRDGTFFLSDQEGFWTPKNRINQVREGGFYGNMWGYHGVTDAADSAMEPPVCWITNAFDRSPAASLWVDGAAWGPLKDSLLSLSYGNGKVFVVPHETVGGKVQGGMCALPIPPFPTGVMRGRFHPGNGQLYLCGMFAWAGDRRQPGGFYRLRATGKPAYLPLGLHARRPGLAITFSAPLDRETAGDPARYSAKTWSLKRSEKYGSDHFDERPSPITRATLSDDGRTVTLAMPEIRPTWCMEVKYSLKGAGGEAVEGVIHNTIHAVGD